MSKIYFSLLSILCFVAILASKVFADTDDKKQGSPVSFSNDKKVGSSSPTRYSNAWLPDWLPNIHKLNRKACRSISDFRKNSPIVKQIIEHKSDANAQVNLQSVSDKIKLAAAAGGGDLRKALGYKTERVTGHGKGKFVTPRLLCLGFSHLDKGNEETALGRVYQAWAKNCHHTLLYTKMKSIPGVPAENTREIHPIQGDMPHNLWQKMRLALSMLTDPAQDGAILQDCDYVIMFGDDSFFSVANVNAMLMEPYVVAANRLNALLLIGHRMVDTNNVFASNLGYIMNRRLIRVLADLVNTPACDPMAITGSDDIQLGKCLTTYGITAVDSYDEIGEDRMVMWEPDMIQHSVHNGFPDWYIRFREGRPVPKSLAIVSQHACAFHGADQQEKVDRLVKLVGGGN